ncbi:ALI_collapsed_G0005800.mRNA.1.CDS.1 [Saccharomyces cerevisiae]|nr:ALI_collapsed_G0005800.mRNA.1.CDS.1 [Saccharomyces cerevisiae]
MAHVHATYVYTSGALLQLGRIARGKHCADFPRVVAYNISRFGVLNKSVVGSFNQWLGGISRAQTNSAHIRQFIGGHRLGRRGHDLFFLRKKSVTFP